MKLELTPQAEQDFAYWNRTDAKKTARIVALLQSIAQTPHSGLGKPEALQYELLGYWSRRIDREHLLVYQVEGDTIYILSCRYYY